MNKALFLIPLVLLGGSCSIPQSSRSETTVQQTHPTQEEWLEVWLRHQVMSLTDSWKTRTNTVVSINDKSIVVTITTANGEETLSERAQQDYINLVQPRVDSILEEYPWAQDLELTVWFL